MKFYAIYLRRYFQGFLLRTMLLVFGVSISVLLITFIGILTDSIRATDMESRYSQYGMFQGLVAGISSYGEEMAEKESRIGNKAYSEICGATWVGNEATFIGTMDSLATELIHIEMCSGRWPQNTDEIAVQDIAFKSMGIDANIGDQISLDITVYGREKVSTIKKEYTLVGIFRNNALQSAIRYSNHMLDENALRSVMPSFLITQEAVNEFKDEYLTQRNLIFTLKDKKNAKDTMESLKLDGTLLPNVIYILNHDKSWTQRDQNTKAEGIILIILTILFTLIGSINSFFITVQERENQIGILRALGAKRSQIRSLILNEAVVISLLSIPFGVLSAVGVIRLVLRIVQSLSGQFQVIKMNPGTITLCVIVSVLSVFVAALFPATRATYVSPMNAIVGQNSTVIKTPSFQLHDKEALFSLRKSITYQMTVRNLKRQKKRSVPVAMVVFLAVIISLFSYNMNHVFTLDLKRDMDKCAYAYHLKGNTILKTGIVSPEGGLSIDEIDELRELSEITEIDAYKILNGAVCGVSSSNISEYAKSLSGYILEESIMSQWQQEAAVSMESGMQPVNIQIIGIEEQKLRELYPNTDIGDLHHALLYVPTAGKWGSETASDIGLQKGDSVRVVWYKNQGSSNWDMADFKIDGMIHSLPGNMAKEPEFGEKVCIFINEKYFSELTNESLFNSVYVYTGQEIGFEKLEERINKIAGKGKNISLESQTDEIKEFIQYSKMMAAKLFSTSIIVSILVLLIIFYTVFSAVLIRKREIGMLRAVGMTKKQLNRMICAENVMICLGAAFCGMLAVFPLITGALRAEGFSVWNNVPWLFLTIVLIVCFIIAAIITLYAIRIVMKKGIIDSIRMPE